MHNCQRLVLLSVILLLCACAPTGDDDKGSNNADNNQNAGQPDADQPDADQADAGDERDLPGDAETTEDLPPVDLGTIDVPEEDTQAQDLPEDLAEEDTSAPDLTPDSVEDPCQGLQCGPDGQGGQCGTCPDNQTCDAQGQCQDVPQENRPPVVLDFSANTRRLTTNETLTLTVIVTDPDGIDDLIGGSLVNAEAGLTYGAFTTTASEGSYTIDLTWNEIHNIQAIDFTEETDRTFQARFFDVSGAETTSTLTIALHCDGLGACNGVCTNLNSTNNCGACGTPCADNQNCEAGVCACPDPRLQCGDTCLDPRADANNCGACNNVCGDDQVCNAGECVCPEEQTVCGGSCVDTFTDEANCGGCGITCVADARCFISGVGTCTCAVVDGQYTCPQDQTCLITRRDSNNNPSARACTTLDEFRLTNGTEGYVETRLFGLWHHVCVGSQDFARLACAARGENWRPSNIRYMRDGIPNPGQAIEEVDCDWRDDEMGDCELGDLTNRCRFNSLYVECEEADPNAEGSPATCADGVDNDLDFHTDCDDYKCGGVEACQTNVCFQGTTLRFNQNGTLEPGDRLGGPRDNAYFDAYFLEGDSFDTFEVIVESDDFRPVLTWHQRNNCSVITERVADFRGRARIEISPSFNDYYIVVTSANPGQRGDYTLTYRRP